MIAGEVMFSYLEFNAFFALKLYLQIPKILINLTFGPLK